MNESIFFLQKWLSEGETITHVVEDIFWQLESCYPVFHQLPNHGKPSSYGSIVLTNRRLIIIDRNATKPTEPPIWYSVNGIASLSERPPRHYNKDWPYQASLALYSGVILVLETPKDLIDERGKILSTFLVNAFFQLNSGQQAGLLFREYAEQYEEEQRRKQDDDYRRKQDTDK